MEHDEVAVGDKQCEVLVKIERIVFDEDFALIAGIEQAFLNVRRDRMFDEYHHVGLSLGDQTTHFVVDFGSLAPLINQAGRNVNFALGIQLFEQLGAGADAVQVAVVGIVDDPGAAELVGLHAVLKWRRGGNAGFNVRFGEAEFVGQGYGKGQRSNIMTAEQLAVQFQFVLAFLHSKTRTVQADPHAAHPPAQRAILAVELLARLHKLQRIRRFSIHKSVLGRHRASY